MKFGSHLKAHRTPHWKFNFVDYDGLKAHLKTYTDDREFTEQNEDQFIKMLRSELDKVASFQGLKLGEVLRRTDHCEHTIQQHQMPAKSSERLTLASFVVTESEINKITQDVQDLARYQRLNYTAFLKIIKKHDKHTGYTLRTRLMSWLNNQPFHKESFAPLVSRLSTLYNIVRTGNAPAASKARSIDSSEEEEEELEQHPGYVPKKSAYWVHSDSIMDLKMLILKYLPLVVYEPTPALSSSHRSTSSQMSTCLASESPVSTVYLDNEDFELYTAQVEHRDTAETVRLRWYGSESKHIWVEHQQKTTVAASPPPSGPPSPANKLVTTKHRFQLKAKYVPNLVQGTAELGKSVQQMRLSGQKSAQEMEQFEQSTCNVQTRVQQRRLQPVVQTFFNRTAFQVPGDARVRITIDTDVVMVRERRIETSDIYKRPWNPTDLKTDNYPFSHVRAQDIVRFPFAVMQIRTLTEPDEETPAWVDYIAQSPLVQLVPNFSKDLHAIATLYESRVSLLPFWLSDMDRDLWKSTPMVPSQDSNSNSGSSGSSGSSNDTLNSSQSTTATTMSDSGLSRLIKMHSKTRMCSQQRARQSILDPERFFSPGVTFEDEVLHELQQHQQQNLTVHRLTVDPSQGSNSVRGSSGRCVLKDPFGLKSHQPKSCLKKHGSLSSLQSRNSSSEDLQSSTSTLTRSYPHLQYGSLPSSSSTHKSIRTRPAEKLNWLQSVKQHFWGSSDEYEYEEDLESQLYDYSKSTSKDSDWRASLTALSWTLLNVSNIMLLFVGVVLAMMNVGDGIGLMQASLFLLVTCLCMASTVWAYLSRMDDQHSTDNDDEEECVVASEATGLLDETRAKSEAGREWKRTVMPVLMFLCLSITVAMNAVVQLRRPYDEETGRL
ncbi:vacuolar transporter chaperone [Podila minutissima]|nr:vacuolar transporter chaperone [Podila minutissima]